jgi:hypothetical protein
MPENQPSASLGFGVFGWNYGRTQTAAQLAAVPESWAIFLSKFGTLKTIALGQ